MYTVQVSSAALFRGRRQTDDTENNIWSMYGRSNRYGFLIGAKTAPPTQNSKDMLDMRTVTDFKATDTGLTLYTKDGDGYYCER